MFYLSLYPERARVHAALGKWDQAEQDLEAMLGQMPANNPIYQIHGTAHLLRGLLHERRGDAAAAKASWKAGLYSAWLARLPDALKDLKEKRTSRVPLPGLLYHLILASLCDELPDAEAEKITSQIQEMVFGRQLGSQFLAVMKVQPSVLREMWRSPRGRELARQMAFLDLAPREFFRQPAYLGVAEKFRQDVLRQPPTAEQEAEIWEAITTVGGAVLDREVRMNQMIQLGLAYKGTAGFLGWGGVAPALPPRLRAPAAYLLGLRYITLKDPKEAANFFRTAIRDAPAESRLRRLAQAELDGLMKK